MSSMVVPRLNAVVLYYKTTMWSCLSWTTCSHVCSRTSSCFGACYRSLFPRISQRHLVDLCCRLSFFFLDLMSLEYPDTNQIWISGSYDGWNIPNICILFPACTSVVVVQDHLQKWTYHGSHPFPMISKNHPLRCLQQGSPHHPF